MTDTLITRHTVSGVINKATPRNLVEHPHFGKFLEVVDENAKPRVRAINVAAVDAPAKAPVGLKPTPKEESKN